MTKTIFTKSYNFVRVAPSLKIRDEKKEKKTTAIPKKSSLFWLYVKPKGHLYQMVHVLSVNLLTPSLAHSHQKTLHLYTCFHLHKMQVYIPPSFHKLTKIQPNWVRQPGCIDKFPIKFSSASQPAKIIMSVQIQLKYMEFMSFLGALRNMRYYADLFN